MHVSVQCFHLLHVLHCQLCQRKCCNSVGDLYIPKLKIISRQSHPKDRIPWQFIMPAKTLQSTFMYFRGSSYSCGKSTCVWLYKMNPPLYPIMPAPWPPIKLEYSKPKSAWRLPEMLSRRCRGKT